MRRGGVWESTGEDSFLGDGDGRGGSGGGGGGTARHREAATMRLLLREARSKRELLSELNAAANIEGLPRLGGTGATNNPLALDELARDVGGAAAGVVLRAAAKLRSRLGNAGSGSSFGSLGRRALFIDRNQTGILLHRPLWFVNMLCGNFTRLAVVLNRIGQCSQIAR